LSRPLLKPVPDRLRNSWRLVDWL